MINNNFNETDSLMMDDWGWMKLVEIQSKVFRTSTYKRYHCQVDCTRSSAIADKPCAAGL